MADVEAFDIDHAIQQRIVQGLMDAETRRVGEIMTGRHLHRMVPDGPTRFVGGRRQVHQVCECGEEGWR